MLDLVKAARKRRNVALLPWVLKNKYPAGNINVSAARYMLLYPKLKLAFNRVKKNGNSTTATLLHTMEIGTTKGPRTAKKSTSLRTANLNELLASRDYFHFVIIRDPFSRILSAFLNKFSKDAFIERYGNFDLTPEGFENFLRWLQDHGLEDDLHWDLQKRMIFGQLEDYDAVLRFEDFPHCLVELLNSRGLEIPETSAKIFGSVHKGSRTGAIRRLQEFYRPKSTALVQSLYKDDFEFLGYSPDLSDLLKGQDAQSPETAHQASV